jgi:hypothetical protein
VKLQHQLMVFLALTMLITPAKQAWANMAAPWDPAVPVGEPLEGLANIWITAEELSFDLLGLAEDGLSYKVSATYQLENKGALIKNKLVFIAPGVKEATVLFDGKMLTHRLEQEFPIPDEWAAPETSPGLWQNDPLPIRYLGISMGDKEERITKGLTFYGNFTPGLHELTVKYTAYAGRFHGSAATIVYQVPYVLSPARSWAGFGKLIMHIKWPDSWQLAASLPMTCKPGICDAVYEGLPEDDLVISLGPTIEAWRLTAAEAAPLFGMFLGLILSLIIGRRLGKAAPTGSKLKDTVRTLGYISVAMVSTCVLVVVISLVTSNLLIEELNLSRTYSYSKMMGTILLTPAAGAVSMLMTPLVAVFTARRKAKLA